MKPIMAQFIDKVMGGVIDEVTVEIMDKVKDGVEPLMES